MWESEWRENDHCTKHTCVYMYTYILYSVHCTNIYDISTAYKFCCNEIIIINNNKNKINIVHEPYSSKTTKQKSIDWIYCI